MKIEIPKAIITKLTDKSRPIIDGVYLDPEKSALVVTNGRSLIKTPTEFPKDFAALFIPSSEFEKAGKTKPSIPFTIEVHGDDIEITGSVKTIKITRDELAENSPGKFPAWTQVVPNSKPKVRLSFSANVLASLAAALSTNNGQIYIETDGDQFTPLTVYGEKDSSIGVLMPMRGNEGIRSDDDIARDNWGNPAATTPEPEPEPEKPKRKETAPATSPPTLKRNARHNGIELYFDGKPDDETREAMKSHGFRWGAGIKGKPWYARYTEERMTMACKLAKVEASEVVAA